MTEQDPGVFKRIYSHARTCEELPWHREEPPELLARAVEQRKSPGRALDVGCGAGTHSLYLARHGYDVVAVDFIAQAVEMARRRVADAGLDIEVVQADVTRWSSPRPFDIVLDVGCLHSLPGSLRSVYRERLIQWLAPGGEFILTHFARRGWWDRWPVGPNRVAAGKIIDLLGGDLELVEQDARVETSFPWFMGSSALIGYYRFRRAAAG